MTSLKLINYLLSDFDLGIGIGRVCEKLVQPILIPYKYIPDSSRDRT